MAKIIRLRAGRRGRIGPRLSLFSIVFISTFMLAFWGTFVAAFSIAYGESAEQAPTFVERLMGIGQPEIPAPNEIPPAAPPDIPSGPHPPYVWPENITPTVTKRIEDISGLPVTVKPITVRPGITVLPTAEIESHGASLGLTKQITGCYKRVPAALLARTGSPRIVVAKDHATVITLLSLPTDFFIKEFANQATELRGIAFPAGTRRTIIFFENTLRTDHPNYVCNVVIHELAHLYDYSPSSLPAARQQSDNENFSKAFKQDIADIDKKRSTTNGMRETVEKHKYYMSHAREAFAEAVSRTIFLHPNMKPYKIYAGLFPNVMSHVRKLLIDDGIIPPDHKGDAEIVREFEKRR
jgi:hypothetical protein